MSRESLARAINSSNLKQHEKHCTVDELHALGLSGINHPIGAATIHLIDGLQPKSYQQLIYLLVKRASIKFKMNRDLMARMAEQVVKESAFRFCRTCQGRKEVKLGEKILTCHHCNGSGLYRHSDIERSQAIGVSLETYHHGLQHRFQYIQSVFTNEMKESLIYIKKTLENY